MSLQGLDVIDPRRVTRDDFMQACLNNVVLYHVRQLWLMEHEVSFEQALTAAVLILAKENALLRERFKSDAERESDGTN